MSKSNNLRIKLTEASKVYCSVSLNEYCIIQNSNSEKPDTNIETVSGPCNTCFWYARAPAVRNTSRGGARAYQKHVLHGPETVSIFIANLLAIFNDVILLCIVSQISNKMTDCIHTASLRQRTKTSQLNASRTRCDRSSCSTTNTTSWRCFICLSVCSNLFDTVGHSSRLTIRFGKRDGALGCCALAIAVTLFAFHPRALSDDRSLQ